MHFELSPDEKKELEPLTGSEVRKPVISVEELEIECEGNEALTNLLKNMLDSCLSYTITVAKFKKIVQDSDGSIDEAREEIENIRGNSHEAMISSVNALSRELVKSFRDTEWMKEVSGNRAKYARFALTLTLSRI